MLMLRWWCALAIAWPILLYGSERFFLPGIHPLVYGLCALAGLAAIAVPGVRRLPLPALLALPVAAFAIRIGLGAAADAQALVALVLVEATLLLATALARCLDGFERAVRRVSTLDLAPLSVPFDAGQSAMFREVRRARRYGRELSLLSLHVDPNGSEESFDRLVAELQRRNVEQYTRAEIARLLAEETHGCEIVTCRNGHFVALLPETDRESATGFARRLHRLASEQLGLELRIGLSSFPDQEITFEGLLRRAETEMTLASEPRGGVRQLLAPGRRSAPATSPASAPAEAAATSGTAA